MNKGSNGRIVAAAGLALVWFLVPARADVLGDLIGTKAAADFAGSWVVAGNASTDIDHIVVTATSSGPARIQVFGRCEARICNWGALPARPRTDGPASETIRSLAADFNLGFALKHITLHRLPGNQLRLDMVTEFTDGSDRHDYETAAALVAAGTVVAARTPSAAPPPPAAAAPPALEPVYNPPPPPSSPGVSLNPLNWFGSKPAAAPVQPAAPQTSVPVDNTIPVVASATPVTDDCFAVDTGHVYVVNTRGNWSVRDFLHVVLGFGPYRVAAEKGLKAIGYYRFDEVCHIGRGSTNMTFLRTAGDVPRQPMPGEDCTAVHFDAVQAVKRDDDWKVVDGAREIYDYGSDEQGAAQAAGAIRALGLARQCYFDRANLTASYWLSR